MQTLRSGPSITDIKATLSEEGQKVTGIWYSSSELFKSHDKPFYSSSKLKQFLTVRH